MTKYEIILYWSDEDQAFIAEVPELAGCAADGVTRQEALANVETVIAEWLEPPGNLDGLSQNPRAGSCSPESAAGSPAQHLFQLLKWPRGVDDFAADHR
jgi:predicted RNase H-like HicB family nuclease